MQNVASRCKILVLVVGLDQTILLLYISTKDHDVIADEARSCSWGLLPDLWYLQAAFGDQAQKELRDKRQNERKAAVQEKGDPNLIPLGVRQPTEVKAPEDPIPEVEWWDMGLLQNKLYEIVAEEISGLREDKITIYVEHPVPLEPPAEEAQPPPQPLPLTRKVRCIIFSSCQYPF